MQNNQTIIKYAKIDRDSHNENQTIIISHVKTEIYENSNTLKNIHLSSQTITGNKSISIIHFEL
jgi:hypothetical protein